MAPKDKDKDKLGLLPDYDKPAPRDITGLGWSPEPSESELAGRATSLGIVSNQPASTWVSPEDQALSQAYFANPEEFAEPEGPAQTVYSFFGRLFDYEDEDETVLETGWDGLLRGMGWVTDKINQGAAWSVSASEGGIDPLTYDQTRNVSVGQAAAAAGAANTQKYGLLGGTAINIATSGLNPISMLTGQTFSGIIGGLDMAGPLGQPGFDVNNPDDRAAAFEESVVGRWTTGLNDATFVVTADPFVFAGKGSKVAKLKYLDDTFQGSDGLLRMKTQMADSLTQEVAQKSPIARFVWEATRVDDVTGKKVLSRAVMMKRLKGATNGELLVDALYSTSDEFTGQLLVRYAFGDIGAGKELLKLNPALYMSVARRQRIQIREMLALDPNLSNEILAKAEKSVNKYDELLAETDPAKNAARYNNVLKRRDRAQRTYDAAYNGTIGDLDEMNDPVLVGLLSKEFNAIVGADKKLAKFLLDEDNMLKQRNMMATANYGFSRNTALGRTIESSRMSRAQTATNIAASRGSLKKTGKFKTVVDSDGVTKQVEIMKRQFWGKNEFNVGAFTRAVNVWRWYGEENPSSFIYTKGAAAMGSWKEIQASINDVKLYGGASRTVIQRVKQEDGSFKETSFEVGGKKRGEQLLNMYMAALNDSAKGDNAAAIAVNKIQAEMFRDIAIWHGLSQPAAKALYSTAKKATGKLKADFSVKDRAFWVEGKTINKAPWLESQIANGDIMINMRAFEKRAASAEIDSDMQNLARSVDVLPRARKVFTVGGDVKELTAEQLSRYYGYFNDIWRPAVLLRLGYTQRNVLEGLFRATAFTFSLDPVRFAIVQSGKAGQNFTNKMFYNAAIGKAESAGVLRQAGENVMMPPNYIKWLAREINARDENIVNLMQFIEQPGRIVENVSLATKEFMQEFYKFKQDFYKGKLDRAKAAGANNSEILEFQKLIDEARNDRVRVGRIRKFQLTAYEDELGKINRTRSSSRRSVTKDDKSARKDELDSANDELLALTTRVLSDLDGVKRELSRSIDSRSSLNNEISALAMYRQQGGSKSRVMNGVITAPDSTVLNAAFNTSNPGLNPILSNLSADATTRSMASSSANTMGNVLRIHRMQYYVSVKPYDEKTGLLSKTYFNGVANALRQIKYSEIGQMAINGNTPEEIASYLMNNKEGRSILHFIVNGWNQEKGTRGTAFQFMGDSEDALLVANNVIDRYLSIAPSPELRDYMRVLDIGASDNLEEAAKKFLLVSGPDGGKKYDLQPVIGYIAEEMGSPGFMQLANRFTGTGMKWLGTYPEDAFVRVPFYGKRYNDTLYEMINTHQSSIGNDMISMREYNDIMQQAHLRALKDTKEWMFTIERRTNLGTYGEVAVPFISAMQNSITTVGGLIWRDPSVAVYMSLAARAPSRADITDQHGNIVIPIPHDWIPDGVEETLGITNTLNAYFGMNQLNLIASQFDSGVFFQFGPLVTIPAAALVESSGLFGASLIYPPDWLSDLVGEEITTGAWDTMKLYLFGGYKDDLGRTQIAKPMTGGIEALFPATLRRFVQYFQKNGNDQYARIYVQNQKTEWAKYRNGLRQEPPTKDEILNLTNNLTIIQLAANALFGFPPRYEFAMQPLVDDYQNMQNESVDKEAADTLFIAKYGSDLLSARNLGLSRSTINAPVTPSMVKESQMYAPLIESLSPDLEKSGALDSLSVLFVKDEESVYDGTVALWQENNPIPGLKQTYKPTPTPEQIEADDNKSAGWEIWLRARERFDLRAAQKGFSTVEQWPDLLAEQDAFKANMAEDPKYQGWWIDYKDAMSERTAGTIQVFQKALAYPPFVENNKNNPVWKAAYEYLEARAYVVNELEASGSTSIKSARNTGLKDWWDTFRAGLKNSYTGWDVLSNRYLDGDDNPAFPGVSQGYGDTYEEE